MQPGGLAYENVQEAIAYRDADAPARREIDEQRKQRRAANIASLQRMGWGRWSFTDDSR
jgi:hypothetical protein